MLSGNAFLTSSSLIASVTFFILPFGSLKSASFSFRS
jgi:hypothetical protein